MSSDDIKKKFDNNVKRTIVRFDPANDPMRKRTVDLSRPILSPDVDEVFGDAMSILANEIETLKSESLMNKGLDAKKTELLLNHIKALVMLSREGREIAKTRKLDQLTDTELMELAKKMLFNK